MRVCVGRTRYDQWMSFCIEDEWRIQCVEGVIRVEKEEKVFDSLSKEKAFHPIVSFATSDVLDSRPSTSCPASTLDISKYHFTNMKIPRITSCSVEMIR